MRRKILLIGATGVFGNRLAGHLAKWADIELIMTSRNLAKAEAAAKQLRSFKTDAKLSTLALDTHEDFQRQLARIKPFCVIDCSGPFQETDHDVAKTVLATGSHMIDLADARKYLQNYSLLLDKTAKGNTATGLTGASSTPALSSAVVDQLIQDWQRVDTIEICITPGGKSEVGKSVLAAILSYAGKKIPSWEEGKLSSTHAWLGSILIEVPELGRRRIAPVDTIDAQFLGGRHNVASKVVFSAGLESTIEQMGIRLLAFLVMHKIIWSIKGFTPFLMKLRKITGLFTGDTGAMMVVATGMNEEGILSTARWVLMAKHDHGPFVPILPAAAALRLLLNGGVKPGAGLALDQLSLTVIENEMKPYSISTQTDVTHLRSSLFSTFLGAEKYAQLPPIVRAFHDPDGAPVWIGEADVETSNNYLLSFIGKLLGFPKSGKNVPLCVTVDRRAAFENDGQYTETWIRNFAGNSFSSTLRRQPDGSFVEIFGLLSFNIGLDVEGGILVMPVISWKFGSIPMPKFLAPHSQATESKDEQGRFQFDVKLTLPILGLFAHYRGWLKPRKN